MMYYDDMDSKHGFQDGEAVPVGAEQYREVYVRYVNRRLAGLGSAVRLGAHDRPGMHNWCLVLRLPAPLTAGWPEDDFLDPDKVARLYGPGAVEPDPDDAFYDALEQAREADLDQYLDVGVKIAPSFYRLLEAEGAKDGQVSQA